MIDMKFYRHVFVAVFAAMIFPSFTLAGNEDSLGRQAEKEGKLKQALMHYIEALKADEANRQLREKIIKLANKIQPPPVVPEEAEKHMARARAAFKLARDSHGYLNAAKEVQAALHIAPWCANAYFDLGVVLDKAGKYDEAVKNLKFYLMSAPDDRDAKNLVYEIEYRSEEAKRVREEAPQVKNINAKDLVGWWTYTNLLNETMRWEIKLRGDRLVFPQMFMSEGDWELKLEGLELKGTIRGNIHGSVSESCLFSNIDYFKRKIFQDVTVTGKVSKGMDYILLNYRQPFIDKNNNCKVSYKMRTAHFIRQ